MTKLAADILGAAIDRLDAAAHALELPLPAETHAKCLRQILPEVVEQLKSAYVKATGENPWELEP